MRIVSRTLTMSPEAAELVIAVRETLAEMGNIAISARGGAGTRLRTAFDAWEESELVRLRELQDKEG